MCGGLHLGKQRRSCHVWHWVVQTKKRGGGCGVGRLIFVGLGVIRNENVCKAGAWCDLRIFVVRHSADLHSNNSLTAGGSGTSKRGLGCAQLRSMLS